MQVELERTGPVVVARLIGRLDANTARTLEQELLPQVTAEAQVIADLTRLVYVSSAGLRVFLLAAKQAKRVQARIALAGLSDNVREVFDISGFSSLFTLRPTVDEALAAVRE